MEKIYKELNHDGFVIRERASASMLMGALGYLCYVKLDLRNQSLDLPVSIREHLHPNK